MQICGLLLIKFYSTQAVAITGGQASTNITLIYRRVPWQGSPQPFPELPSR